MRRCGMTELGIPYATHSGMTSTIPTLAALAANDIARSLAASAAYRAARGDIDGAANALAARAFWIVDQQHKHLGVARFTDATATLAANDR